MKNKIEKTTIVGGDFNTVGDVTLDAASRKPLAYPNIGVALLSQIMSDKGLVDERREQLGDEVEYTRKGNTTNGTTRNDEYAHRQVVPTGKDYELPVNLLG